MDWQGDAEDWYGSAEIEDDASGWHVRRLHGPNRPPLLANVPYDHRIDALSGVVNVLPSDELALGEQSARCRRRKGRAHWTCGTLRRHERLSGIPKSNAEEYLDPTEQQPFGFTTP